MSLSVQPDGRPMHRAVDEEPLCQCEIQIPRHREGIRSPVYVKTAPQPSGGISSRLYVFQTAQRLRHAHLHDQ